MLVGVVNNDGLPVIPYAVGGTDWSAVIDTGFSGDLELPDTLRGMFPERPDLPIIFLLGAGQAIMQQSYRIDFPFDGQTVEAITTYARRLDILIGTGLLKDYRLEVNFAARTVLLERVAP
jgi:predicted aspartyl protease